MDSDDLVLDSSVASGLEQEPPSSGSKFLKAVAIPLSNPKKPAARNRQALSESPSTASSALSSYRDHSIEHDTPGTSAAVTPAEFNTDRRKTSLLQGNIAKGLLSKKQGAKCGTPSLAASKGKSKRKVEEDTEDQVMEDSLLAQQLQEEEYAKTVLKPGFPKSRRARATILDSEDEVDDSIKISSEPEIAASTRASSLHDRHKVKRVKTVGGISLPSRAARDSARKSIAEKASLVIMDSDGEDESELSEYDSEVDSELEYSDMDDEEAFVDPTDLAAAANITAAPETLPSARRRRRSPHTASDRRSRFSWLAKRASNSELRTVR